jgi:cobalt/nickel transport system permease protein
MTAIAPLTTDRPANSARGRRHGGARPEGRVGWLEQTLGGITGSIEHAIFTEQHARLDGWLQRRDPRAKLGVFLAIVLAASLTSSVGVLAAIYAAILAAARASRVPFSFFVKRVWLGIPLFAGIVVIPAIFMVPGPRLFDLGLGPLHVAPSVTGLAGAVLFVARVGVSVSLAVLLVMTTPWADILKSLRSLRVPQVFVLILSMTYRYIFLFLHTTNGILLARKSRVVARTTGGEQRRWISGTMGNLMSRAFKMSNDVYAAMLARGFSGEMRALSLYRMRAADWATLGGAMALGVAAVLVGRTLP